jgi:hypothetical protein
VAKKLVAGFCIAGPDALRTCQYRHSVK